MKESKKKESYPKSIRIFAIVCAILLALMYIITLVTALFTSEEAPHLFRMCFGATILLPIMLWLYIRFYKLTKRKDQDDEEEKNNQNM